eukprot:COSAG06_NODE_544_length_14458_cov_18.391671_1_plen_108_part_10
MRYALAGDTLARAHALSLPRRTLLQVASAGGNVALSLLLRAATNVLSIFTIPFFLKLYISTDYFPMLIKLLVFIFLPLISGKMLREICHRVSQLLLRMETQCFTVFLL